MAYTTIAKVKAMFRNFTGNTSNQAITDATLTEWITAKDARINSRISRYYELPIIASESLLILEEISCLMVAHQVDNVLNNYTDAQKKPDYAKQADALLNEYAPLPKDNCKPCEPVSRLPDATYTGLQNDKRRLSVSVTTTAPIFQKGVDSW